MTQFSVAGSSTTKSSTVTSRVSPPRHTVRVIVLAGRTAQVGGNLTALLPDQKLPRFPGLFGNELRIQMRGQEIIGPVGVVPQQAEPPRRRTRIVQVADGVEIGIGVGPDGPGAGDGFDSGGNDARIVPRGQHPVPEL